MSKKDETIRPLSQIKLASIDLRVRFFCNCCLHEITNAIEDGQRWVTLYRFEGGDDPRRIYREKADILDTADMFANIVRFIEKAYLQVTRSETDSGSAGTQPEEG